MLLDRAFIMIDDPKEPPMESHSHWGMFPTPPKRRNSDKPKLVIKHKKVTDNNDLKIDIDV